MWRMGNSKLQTASGISDFADGISHDVENCFFRGGPLASLARTYFKALRHLASQMISDAVKAGTSAKEIYLQVFQPGQCKVERLREFNRISVAQQHHSTAATQLIMSRLYPHAFPDADFVEIPASARVKILVGGYPFTLSPNLWREVGADGSASDAERAIALADEMAREGAP